ncbi:MAG: polysaccharide biosynthesis C-terminal domain-containing protein, partial [Lachnospiraceae bacterium]|nr:polysaccharide biosynthesis C-terminal domain-containing protein [Lachnospiraceae bacterium]
YKKTPIIAASSCVAALLNYLLNLCFIPRFGYIAASYTTLASYIVLMLLHYIAVRFYLKETVYDSRYMFLALGGVILIGLSMLLLYGDALGTRLLRYAYALLLSGVFAFIYRNDIITLIDYFKNRYGKKNQ